MKLKEEAEMKNYFFAHPMEVGSRLTDVHYHGGTFRNLKFTAVTAIEFLNEHSATSKYEIYLVSPGIAKG